MERFRQLNLRWKKGHFNLCLKGSRYAENIQIYTFEKLCDLCLKSIFSSWATRRKVSRTQSDKYPFNS
jgi:hypothetical protein